MGRKSSTSLDY